MQTYFQYSQYFHYTFFYTNNPSTCSAFIKPSFIVNPPNTLSTFILPCIGCYKIGQALSPHSQTSCPAI